MRPLRVEVFQCWWAVVAAVCLLSCRDGGTKWEPTPASSADIFHQIESAAVRGDIVEAGRLVDELERQAGVELADLIELDRSLSGEAFDDLRPRIRQWAHQQVAGNEEMAERLRRQWEMHDRAAAGHLDETFLEWPIQTLPKQED